MTWLDKLLMKIAAAKAAARSGMSPEHAATSLLKAFASINEGSSGTSQSVAPEGRK